MLVEFDVVHRDFVCLSKKTNFTKSKFIESDLRFFKIKKKKKPFLGLQRKQKKKFILFFQKNLKIASHCVEFYEHEKF